MARFVAHSGMVVTDLERSIRFYCDLLGFRRDRTLAMSAEELGGFLGLDPPADLRAAYLYLGDFQLELMTFSPPGADRGRTRTMSEIGLTHISIAVEDVQQVIDQLAAFGGELMSTIGGRAAMLRDPDGQLIEILDAAYAGPERLRGEFGRSRSGSADT